MRVPVILLLVACGTMCFAQSPVFKVIACSEGVVIGNSPVTAGMKVMSSRESLKIPEGGYVSVVTAYGDIGKFTKSIKVTRVKRALSEKKLTITGAVSRTVREVYFPMAPENNKADMIGDSLFMYWEGYYPAPDGYRFTLADIYDQPIDKTETSKNWVLLDLSATRIKDTAILFEVMNLKGDHKSGQYLLKFVSKTDLDAVTKRIAGELDPFSDDPDMLFFECAILELNNLFLDKHLTVYKILSQQKQPSDPFLKKYFDRMTEKYGLNKIQID